MWADVTSCVSLNAESAHFMLQLSLCKSQHTATALFSPHELIYDTRDTFLIVPSLPLLLVLYGYMWLLCEGRSGEVG